MNSTFPPAPEAPGPQRTVLRELFTGIAQLGSLGILGLFLIVGLIFIVGASAQFRKARASYETAMKGRVREAQMLLQVAELEQSNYTINWPREIPIPVEEDPPGITAPGKPAGSAAAPGSSGAPGSAPNVPVAPTENLSKHELLLRTVRNPGWHNQIKNVDEVKNAPADEGPRKELREELTRQTAEGKVPPVTVANICHAWRDPQLAKVVLEALDQQAAKLTGKMSYLTTVEFYQYADPERVTQVLPKLANGQMTRSGGPTPDYAECRQLGAAIAAYAPADSRVFAELIAADSPAGDIVRGALGQMKTWPEPAIAALITAISDPKYFFRGTLHVWLSENPPPQAVAEALLPAAIKLIRREVVDINHEELYGIQMVSLCTRSGSASRVAKGAVRLQESNPEAARVLLVHLLLVHPVDTLTAMAESADAGKPVPPPDLDASVWKTWREGLRFPRSQAVASLEAPHIGRWVDGIIASRLAGTPADQWSSGLITEAALWGGPVTSALLKSQAKNATLTDATRESFFAAAQKINVRVAKLAKMQESAQ